jgi:hypothetical protein
MHLLHHIAFRAQLQELDGDFEANEHFELQIVDRLASCLESFLELAGLDHVWVWIVVEILRNESESFSTPISRDLMELDVKIVITSRLL